MYSRTTVQAQNSPGSRTVRPLINILTASCRTTFSLASSLSTVHPPLLPFLLLFLFPFDILTALFLTECTVTIVARHCFEYNGDISMCLEVIRPDFSSCEKSNTPKGQKNNKHLQLLAVWHSIFTQTVFAASGQSSLSFLGLKGTKQKRFKCFKCGQLSCVLCMACKLQGKSLFVTMRVWAGYVCLYVRELSEICGVEIQPLRQSLHQVQALVSGEGAGGETHRQQSITFGGPYPYKIHAAIQPLKCYFFREILQQFIPTNGSLHTSKSYGCLNECTAHMYTTKDRHTGKHKRKHTHTQSAMPREKGSAASSGLVNHMLFSSNETNNKVQMEPA